ncbi:MAG: phosphomannomutase [Planctomycetaceae bacterium]|nr:phosphomannomutase [Planctomycetaceae bacterium]
MTNPDGTFDASDALSLLAEADRSGVLSPGAVQNIRRWLSEPHYAKYAQQVQEHLSRGQWRELDDAFWTVIPFGTGGRRGRMYPIGSNAINDRTIGESAQGLADYITSQSPTNRLACAIAYDTRHRSRHFAELCCSVMVAAGFQVYFLDDFRATPELSYLVRARNCHCGIMVTASHNPPRDNAVKVYWSTGGQILPPHDQKIIDQVMQVQQIRSTPFQDALAQEKITICTAETDAAYTARVVREAFPGSRDLRIIYSPLHGVGAAAVIPVLTGDGFDDVEVYGPHAEPNGDFPNVPEQVANPENPAVFDVLIQRAQETHAGLVLATDPDCDRMGCAAPETMNPTGPWATFNGNQLGALLADYVLQQRQRNGTLSTDHYLIKTLVTTDLVRRIGDSYGVQTEGNLLVGFKWIAQIIDQRGPETFVYGTEESHGFMTGDYVRDKDGAVACMLMAELAAEVKAAGQSLHEKLDELYQRHGYHAERLMTIQMPGSEGMSAMQQLMQRFRQSPPDQLAGQAVTAVRDYWNQETRQADGSSEPLSGPRGNLIILDLADAGNYIAVRPSGTEPKVKFYSFTYQAPELVTDLAATKIEMKARLDQIALDLRAFGESTV